VRAYVRLRVHLYANLCVADYWIALALAGRAHRNKKVFSERDEMEAYASLQDLEEPEP
jgi:hypothetical protein